MRTLFVVLASSFAFAACEKEVDHVGGAAGRQMDEVRVKMDRVEGKLEGKANEAQAASAAAD